MDEGRLLDELMASGGRTVTDTTAAATTASDTVVTSTAAIEPHTLNKTDLNATPDSDHELPSGANMVEERQVEDSAAARVASTPELVEAILAYVKPVDLLFRTQRACKDFKHQIDSSPTIRRKMFRENSNLTGPKWFPYTLKSLPIKEEYDNPTLGTRILELQVDAKEGLRTVQNLERFSSIQHLPFSQPPLLLDRILGSVSNSGTTGEIEDVEFPQPTVFNIGLALTTIKNSRTKRKAFYGEPFHITILCRCSLQERDVGE
jgi:hypothetical protein